MAKALYQSVVLVVLAFLCVPPSVLHAANALETYIQQPDDSFNWQVAAQTETEAFAITQVSMTSQTWRGHFWSHDVRIIRPQRIRHPGIALLFIAGDRSGTGSVALLQTLADRAGAIVAEVTRVPNQPLFEGRREDALIAYTFDQFLRTGDETWPALFPMTKSAVRAMDTVQAWAREQHGQHIEHFVVAGASKRGWTTWLTAAVDPRVAAIAPIVIDVLNMKAQMDWAEKLYGTQSEKLSDYTNLNLVQKMDTPAMRKLRSWVDPYSYRERYTMPKLLLLGTNDPYWSVDALRHYWNDLPEPKDVLYTPNSGHQLSPDAAETLAAFFQMLAEKEDLPKMEWQMADEGPGRLKIKVDRPATAIHLWTADSVTRDFRQAKWNKQALEIKPGSSQASAAIDKPAKGYRAFMGEVVLKSSTGHEYKLSTPVQVIPDEVQ
jgi:PhoPQ-activated pathogenicity-related protein